MGEEEHFWEKKISAIVERERERERESNKNLVKKCFNGVLNKPLSWSDNNKIKTQHTLCIKKTNLQWTKPMVTNG